MRASPFRFGMSRLAAGAAAVIMSTAAFASEPFRCVIPGGVLEIPVPSGWEANPRLAQDNGVLAFLHPSGMAPGDQVPAWVIVDRDSLVEGPMFADKRRNILAEGRGYGFVPTDSAAVQAAGGNVVFDYTFKTAQDSLHHGLGMLDSPTGVILLRYQASSEAVWRERKEGILSILRGVRLARS